MKVYRYFISVLESRYFIAWITVMGIVFRLALIHYTAAHHNTVFPDEKDYQRIGASLSHGGPYSIDGIHLSAYRPPAQPWLIAVLFRLFGPNVEYVKVVEALLLAFLPFVCSFMGRSLGLSVAAANFGAALASLHPGLAYASTTLYPTVLTAFALTVGLYMSVLVLNGRSKGAAVGAGLAFGLAASSTTTFAPLAVVAALIMAIKRRYAAALIVAVLGSVSVLAWMVRNKVDLGEFTVATNGAVNLYYGANDFATPMSGNEVPDEILAHMSRFRERDSEDFYRAAAPRWIKTHPLQWGRLVFLRAIVVFDSVGNPKTQGMHSGFAAHVVGWLMLPAILLSVAGLGFSYKFPLAWLTAAMLSLVIFSSALTISKPRFRFPCDPGLCVFSAVGFVALWEKRKKPRSGSDQVEASHSSHATYN